jgi:hypothetical protein
MKFEVDRFKQPEEELDGMPVEMPEAPTDDLGFAGTVGDIAAAPFRGIAGAVESVWDLADWIAQDLLPDAPDNLGIGQSKTMAGSLIQGISQFATGFVPGLWGVGHLGKVAGLAGRAGKITKMTRAAKIAGKTKKAAAIKWGAEFGKAAGAGAIADFAVFDAQEERLSNLIQQFPALENPVTEFLAAEEGDSEVEGRLKNLLEGGILGVASEPFVIGLRALRAARKLKREGVDPNEALTKAHEEEMARRPRVEERVDEVDEVIDEVVEEIPEFPPLPSGAQRPAEGSIYNMIFFSETEGADRALRAAINTGSPEFQAAIRTIDTLSHTEVMAMAKEMQDELNLVGANGFSRRELDQLDSSGQLREIIAKQKVLRDFHQEYTKFMDEFAVAADGRTHQQRTLFLLARERAESVGVVVKRNQEKIAQGLRAQAIEGADTSLTMRDMFPAEALDDVSDEFFDSTLREMGGGDLDEGVRVVDKMIEDYRNASATQGAAGGYRVLINQHKYAHMLTEYWMNSILSGPLTHMVNMTSNTLHTFFRPIEKAAGQAATGNFQAAADELKVIQYAFQNIGDAWTAARTAFKNDADVLDAMGKTEWERSGNRAISARTLNLDENSVAGTAVEWTGKALNLPGRFLMAEDAFFKHLNYRASAKAQLTAEGIKNKLTGRNLATFVERQFEKVIDKGQFYTYKNLRASAEREARGLFGQTRNLELRDSQMKGHVRRYMDSKWDKSLTPLADRAREYAREITYTRSLNKPGRPGLIGLAGHVQRMATQYPLMRLFVPFIRTPTNLVAYFLDRTVGANMRIAKRGINVSTKLLRGETDAIAKSMSKGGPEWADTVGRAATGYAFMGTALMAYTNGTLTGGGPKDPNQRRLMEATGWQPYSIRVGDEWYSYRRLDPFASFFGIVADTAEAMNETDSEDSDIAEGLAGALVFATARNITNKSYLTGIARLSNVLTNPERAAGSYIEQTVASFGPFSSLAGQTVGMDDTQREIRGILDSVRSKYGLTGEGVFEGIVEPRRNVLGDKLVRPDLAAIPITFYTTVKDDLLMNEMASLGHGFAPPQEVINGLNTTTFRDHKGQSFYDRWQENHGEVRIAGRTIKQSLKNLIKSSRYKKLPPEGFHGEESPRITEIRKIIRAYRGQAFERTLREFPEVRREYSRNTKIKQYRKAGRDISGLLDY